MRQPSHNLCSQDIATRAWHIGSIEKVQIVCRGETCPLVPLRGPWQVLCILAISIVGAFKVMTTSEVMENVDVMLGDGGIKLSRTLTHGCGSKANLCTVISSEGCEAAEVPFAFILASASISEDMDTLKLHPLPIVLLQFVTALCCETMSSPLPH